MALPEASGVKRIPPLSDFCYRFFFKKYSQKLNDGSFTLKLDAYLD